MSGTNDETQLDPYDDAEPAPAGELQVGERIGGRFTIKGKLGQGGMGAVYRAADPELERTVAVKVLSRELANDSALVERMRREARALAQLAHPNVVGIYDVGGEGTRRFLAMEFVEGEALDEALERGALPIEEALEVAIQAAAGLAAAHAQGIVHRDIKPANLIRGNDGVVKVMDFGLARVEAGVSELSQEGMVLGTLHYMSPEQASGEPVDPRTDVYSLGATLFALLTGRPPLIASGTTAMLLKTVSEPAPDPRTLRAEIPPSLAAVVLRCLAKPPEQRYPTIEALREDLIKVRDGDRVDARLPLPRAALAGGAALALALLLLTLGALWPRGEAGTQPQASSSSSSAEVVASSSPDARLPGAAERAFAHLIEVLAGDQDRASKRALCEGFLEVYPAADQAQRRQVEEAIARLDREAAEEERKREREREAKRAWSELLAVIGKDGGKLPAAEAVRRLQAFIAAHGGARPARAAGKLLAKLEGNATRDLERKRAKERARQAARDALAKAVASGDPEALAEALRLARQADLPPPQLARAKALLDSKLAERQRQLTGLRRRFAKALADADWDAAEAALREIRELGDRGLVSRLRGELAAARERAEQRLGAATLAALRSLRAKLLPLLAARQLAAAREAIEGAVRAEPSLTPDRGALLASLERLAAVERALPELLARARLDGRPAKLLFGEKRFAGMKLGPLKNGRPTLKRGAMVVSVDDPLESGDIVRLGELLDWKVEPLTAEVGLELLLALGLQRAAQGVLKREFEGDISRLSPLLRRGLEPDWPAARLEALSRKLAVGGATGDLLRGPWRKHLYPLGTFDARARWPSGRGALLVGRKPLLRLDASWTLTPLRHPRADSRVGLLLRYEVLDAEGKREQLRWTEVALRLDLPQFEIVRRDPKTGGALDRIRELPLADWEPQLARELRLDVVLDPRKKTLVMTAWGDGKQLARRSLAFSERRWLGAGVLALGQDVTLRQLEVR